MVKITEKDRLFIAVALPAALAALYFVFARAPLAKELSAMRSRYEALGTAEEFELERPALQRRRDEAAAKRSEAEAAEAIRIADETGENGIAAGDDATRFSRAAALFDGVPGVKITSAERVDHAGSGELRAKALVREALGVADPDLWRFTVNADYGAIMRALAEAGERGMPAIVDGVSFAGTGGRGAARVWRIDVWL